jgi:hypothetical protein
MRSRTALRRQARLNPDEAVHISVDVLRVRVELNTWQEGEQAVEGETREAVNSRQQCSEHSSERNGGTAGLGRAHSPVRMQE